MNTDNTDITYKKELKYTDTLENNLGVIIYKSLKNHSKKWLVDVKKDRYYNVDIAIISKDNPLKKMYIELKSRDIKYKKFSSLLISHTKMNKIRDKNLKPTIIIWTFNENKIFNSLYFTKYIDDFADYKMYLLQNEKVIYIDKNICTHATNFDSFLQEIHNTLDTL
jgi:hypothetical protein